MDILRKSSATMVGKGGAASADPGRPGRWGGRAPSKRWISVAALLSLVGGTAAVQLRARANEGVHERAPFEIRWTFVGGGRAEWGQCTDTGTLRPEWVSSEIWEDGFSVRIELPAGFEVPCVASRLPKPHRVELFGELSDGPDGVVFPAPDGRWLMFASFDGEPALELGEIGLAPRPGGALRVVWDEGWIEQAPVLSLLAVTLESPSGHGGEPGGEHDDR